MIHRALFGSIERFFGVLTEHYSGAFPAWLAPVQAIAIPVADTFNDYMFDVVAQLKKAGIRADIDASDDRFQKKIRNAQLQKIPFMLIAGEDDMKAGAISFRYRNGEQKNGVPIAEAIKEIAQVVADRVQN
jgi:threonyl-tRNA synthetase